MYEKESLLIGLLVPQRTYALRGPFDPWNFFYFVYILLAWKLIEVDDD